MTRRQGWSDRRPFGLEPLEGRNLLSHLGPVPGRGIVSAEVLPSGSTLALQGSAKGVLHRVQGSPDVGATAAFAATGHVGSLGQVRVTGTLWGTGAIVGGESSGDLFVSNRSGTLNLRLLGPRAGSFTAPTSGQYAYTVIAGTGAHAQTSGQGTITATLGAKSIGLVFAPSHA